MDFNITGWGYKVECKLETNVRKKYRRLRAILDKVPRYKGGLTACFLPRLCLDSGVMVRHIHDNQGVNSDTDARCHPGRNKAGGSGGRRRRRSTCRHFYIDLPVEVDSSPCCKTWVQKTKPDERTAKGRGRKAAVIMK